MSIRVPWTHYQIANSTDDPLYWLRKAEENNWSVRELDAEIKKPAKLEEDEIPTIPKYEVKPGEINHKSYSHKTDVIVCCGKTGDWSMSNMPFLCSNPFII